MDRNKSAYKLKGIPPVLWINLEADTDRRKHMEDQFAEWEIEDHTRISGIDAREGDGFEPHLSGTVPQTMIANEIGCCMSHLKAIKYFIEEMDCDEVMIMEDDALFETVRYWPFTYKEASALFPYNYDAMQLTTINPAVVYVTLHNRFINDFSAAVYVLKRSHAQKIYNAHIRGNKFKMDMDVRPRATSEDLIFESGKVYCIPLFRIVWTLDRQFIQSILTSSIETVTMVSPTSGLNLLTWKTGKLCSTGTAILADFHLDGMRMEKSKDILLTISEVIHTN